MAAGSRAFSLLVATNGRGEERLFWGKSHESEGFVCTGSENALMVSFVLDASVALTWCYPDERSDMAGRVLDALEDAEAIVPSLWAVEIANSLAVGERRLRLSPSDIARFLDLLAALPIELDGYTAAKALNDTLHLARTYRLSAYDAAYLELASREGLALATLDDKLKQTAEKIGLTVLS